MQSERINADRYWQTAEERVLLYLRCLNFPAGQDLELALQVLEEAKTNITSGRSKDDPVATALDVMDELLRKKKSSAAGGEDSLVCGGGREVAGKAAEDGISSYCNGSGPEVGPALTPPIRRLHMRAQELRRSNFLSFFGTRAGRLKKYSGKAK